MGMTPSTTGLLGDSRKSVDVRPGSSRMDFQLWVGPHWESMQRLADRLAPSADADDVLQEALNRAWQRFETFDGERGTPQAWLLAIIADQASKAWRRSSRFVLVEVPPERRAACVVPPDVDLRRAVAALPARQQLAVALFYYLDRPVAEVATAMRCSIGTVKSTLWAARASLKTQLGEPHE